MTKLVWDAVGERKFETGVNRGVLYPPSGSGVSWNGLISVTGKGSGDGTTPYYYDGVRYLNMPSTAEFSATLNAYTYPPELETLEGSVALLTGILADEQMPVAFGLSYRTGIGDDVHGAGFAYKIHLVYNCLAVPADEVYTTDDDKPSATAFSWDISTTPVWVPGIKPASHFTIDSSKVSPYALGKLEDILYGNDITDARMPSITELLALPWGTRQVIVLPYKDESLLPPYAGQGYFVLVKGDSTLYSYGNPTLSGVRPVIVLSDPSDSLPADAIPGDLVYDSSTSELYQLGA